MEAIEQVLGVGCCLIYVHGFQGINTEGKGCFDVLLPLRDL